MADIKDIQMSLRCENSGEEPETNGREAEEEHSRGETEETVKKLQSRSRWQLVLIGIFFVIFISETIYLILTQQSLTRSLAESQHMAEMILTMRNNTKQFQIEISQLRQLLNSTNENFTLLGSEYGQLEHLINAALYNVTLLSTEKTHLSLRLKNTSKEKKHLSMLLKSTSQKKTHLSLLLKNMLQEKTQLEVENKDLTMFLNSTLDNCNVVQEENRQLNLLLKKSLHILSMTSAESRQLRRQLYNEQQTSMQLEAENQHQRSILFSNKLSFLWRFCSESTLQCSRCPPGWNEHNSRCFFLSQEAEKWEDARRHCLDLGADLAVVSDAEDQAFLTNMTFQFVQRHPQENFHSAWIGLQDMVREGTFIWISGNRIHSDVTYWRPLEPNNAMASWDKEKAGQDCVAIVPPKQIVQEGWLNSWDDIVCVGKRHYLCETMALS